MNLTSLYKRRRLRQKPHVLTIEQSRELSQLAGNKLLKHVSDPGLIPNNLFRLRKRKLELIYKYLLDHKLLHDKEPSIESLQTHQLAEYLLNTVYPGYPACRAKNLAYTDYRECREKDITVQTPLAYDYVPTTEVFERLDEAYRIDVNWQEEKNIKTCISISIATLKKSMDRIRAANFESKSAVEYHLYFWNSTKTLLKPHCTSLRLNSEEIWNDENERLVSQGFMHIDITEKLLNAMKCSSSNKPHRQISPEEGARSFSAEDKSANGDKFVTKGVKITAPTNKSSVSITVPSNDKKSTAPLSKPKRSIKLEIKISGDEYNISHISIAAVIKKSTEELVHDLYLQTTTECIARSLQASLCPLDTQQIAVHLLKQYHESEDKLKAAENVFMTCLSNTLNKGFSGSSGSEDDEGEDMIVSLVDPISGSRIQHPIKSLHCKHRSCFDAAIFFDHNAEIKIWHCPICFVHIKNLEELRMDFTNKMALIQYPDEVRLYSFEKDILLSENEMFGEGVAAAGLKRSATDLISHQELEEADATDQTDDEEDSEHHKRFRDLTHVM